jgi:acetyl-CoA C-acetyltransferase
VIHVAHAAEAIAAGKCSVALITLAGRPRAEGHGHRHRAAELRVGGADVQFEYPWGPTW